LTISSFFKELAIAAGGVAVILFILHQFDKFSHLPPFSWSCWLLFVAFSQAVFFFGLRAAQSTNRHDFTNASMGFIFFKMMLSVGFVFIYVKLTQPTDALFIIPFFINYLCFTIFETRFMILLGKMRPKRRVKEGSGV